MDISIIIPVYNEQKNIDAIYRVTNDIISDLGKSFEMIFVDDGSSDGSLKEIETIALFDPRVRCIVLAKNYGQTAALDAGFQGAQGEIILTIDCDLQYDPHDLIGIISELENDDVDAVLGKRVKRSSGWVRNLCSVIATAVRNRILRMHWQDSSLAGYRKKCLENLTLYQDTQVFLPGLLMMRGFRIKEIDVIEHPRRHGKSKYGLRNRFFCRIYALLAIRWLQDNQLKYKVRQSKECAHR